MCPEAPLCQRCASASVSVASFSLLHMRSWSEPTPLQGLCELESQLADAWGDAPLHPCRRTWGVAQEVMRCLGEHSPRAQELPSGVLGAAGAQWGFPASVGIWVQEGDQEPVREGWGHPCLRCRPVVRS